MNLFKISSYLFLIICLSCTVTDKNRNSNVVFNETEHNFGTLKYKGVGEFMFTLKNKGDSTIRITDVKASCGCTTAEWTKKWLKNGESGVIKVLYNTSISGVFAKSICVSFSGMDSPITLIIKGEVDIPDSI